MGSEWSAGLVNGGHEGIRSETTSQVLFSVSDGTVRYYHGAVPLLGYFHQITWAWAKRPRSQSGILTKAVEEIFCCDHHFNTTLIEWCFLTSVLSTEIRLTSYFDQGAIIALPSHVTKGSRGDQIRVISITEVKQNAIDNVLLIDQTNLWCHFACTGISLIPLNYKM